VKTSAIIDKENGARNAFILIWDQPELERLVSTVLE
jgi:hypothetical protein